MDYIGIVCLVIIGLYFIKGFKKGFFVNLLESIKTIGLFILAIMFCEQLGASLLEGSIGASVIGSFENSLLGMNETGFSVVVSSTENLETAIDSVWGIVPMPDALNASCQDLVRSYVETNPGLTIGYYISKALASYVMVVIGFLLILVIGSLVAGILLAIIKKASKKQGFGSRFLGGLVGVVRGLITVSVLCYAVGIIYSFAPTSEVGLFIESSLNNEVGIFKFFYENNFVSMILNLVLESI